MHFELFKPLYSDPVCISHVWHKPQQKVNLLYRHSQLVLCDDVLVDVSINLNDLSLLLLARGEVIALH